MPPRGFAQNNLLETMAERSAEQPLEEVALNANTIVAVNLSDDTFRGRRLYQCVGRRRMAAVEFSKAVLPIGASLFQLPSIKMPISFVPCASGDGRPITHLVRVV